MTNGSDDNYNSPDARGVHKYRFIWKSIVNAPTEDIKNIWLKMDHGFPEFYFEIHIKEGNVFALNEIINVKILRKIEDLSKNFKVIGAKSRNIIIGEINLKEFGIPNSKILILSSLSDWRSYMKYKEMNK